jgi:sugar O-acyltransferase (sialic acid O-acetyltransferase NeuD family)
MKDLYIIGGGGFSSELLFVIERIQAIEKKWNLISVIDDSLIKGTYIRFYKIFGNFNDLLMIDSPIDVVISINDCNERKKIVDKIKYKKNNIFFPNILDTSVIYDSNYLTLGEGNIFMHNTILSTNLVIGDFNIINSFSGIGHDTIIGDYNTFNPRVAISGKVVIGNLNNFGLNSAVLQNRILGSNNEIWFGTIITKNIHDDSKYFGFPAKKISL